MSFPFPVLLTVTELLNVVLLKVIEFVLATTGTCTSGLPVEDPKTVVVPDAVRVPVPEIVPPFTVQFPFTVNPPVSRFIVAPVFIVKFPLSVNEFPFIDKLAPLFKVSEAMDVTSLKAGAFVVEPMITISDEPGNPEGVQFPAKPHSDPRLPFQVYVVAAFASSLVPKFE